MNSFEVTIPMKDHPMVITIKAADKESTYDLYYDNELCGCLFCNEHNVWIYEPHHQHHAALLFDPEHIQQLGHEISQQVKC